MKVLYKHFIKYILKILMALPIKLFEYSIQRTFILLSDSDCVYVTEIFEKFHALAKIQSISRMYLTLLF